MENDLINRKEAIDAICKSCSMKGDYHKCDGYPETSTWCDELVALRAVPSAQQWIPVTERLPEEKVEVLVTVEVNGKKYIENGMLLDVNHRYIGHWETIYDRYEIDVYSNNRNSNIIAWMPLPEPWKGEKNDK